MTTRTPAEVAALFGATEYYIRDLARKRLIPFYRVGRGSPRFSEAHVAAIESYLTEKPIPQTQPRRRARRAS